MSIVPYSTTSDGTRVKTIDNALRAFLDCFVLPRESQQIARIMERFSMAFYKHW